VFTHLHNHTEFSLLDGLSRIKPMVKMAQQLGMDSLAITDHGSLYGAIEFYLECREAGIKPIIGCELYLSDGSRLSKGSADKQNSHLTVLAKNNEGYRNLVELASKAHLEGFYYKPRVDKELLALHGKGLVILSGCLSSEISRLIVAGDMGGARELCQWYQQTFDTFYLEIQRHGNLEKLDSLNNGLLALGHELGIPLVATNDCHYISREDYPLQDILICIHTNTNIEDKKRLKISDDSYYLKSPSEMEELFRDLPEAVANSKRIADDCNVEFPFGEIHIPEFNAPNGEDSLEFLARLCWEGLDRRYPQASSAAIDRLKYELEVIKHTKFANYFLVVWDIASFVHSMGILFGVRGSAAASLALYCLGVTNVDPLAYNLVFERFLNLERKEMPDIDMDFQDDRRAEVINYVGEKYGRDHVAQIITFGTLGAKAAIRDVGRALALPYAVVDYVARLVPAKLHITIEDALEITPELKELYHSDKDLHGGITYSQLIDKAQGLEGVVRHASTHAAGVVITKEPLTNYVPLQRAVRGDVNGMVMTQFAMDPIAKLGLLKMDFLGLTNLTILDKTVLLIKETRGSDVSLQNIPMDDQKTFDLLSTGETTGIFQLESAGMRRYIKDLKPTSLGDIAAMIALYRPGPMEHINTFIRAKHGQEPVRYPHPTLQGILEDTYGVIVYQDQVLLIAQAFAGYTLGEADIVRKAMGKKIPSVMRQEREKFTSGAQAIGFSAQVAEAVFNLVEPFAGYAFNKAHSVSYALIAYWTAYFKANYPVEYMASVLNSHAGQTEKVASDVTECVRLGIQILPPDINRSKVRFGVEQDSEGARAIRFGLSSVKNVGEGAVTPIVEARDAGEYFASLSQLCRRIDLRKVNRRPLESLIKVGALDCMGSRGPLLTSIDKILALSQREARLKESGQTTLFNLFGETAEVPLDNIAIEGDDISARERISWEKELLGVALSYNPLSSLAFASSTQAIASRDQVDNNMVGRRVILVGQVASVRHLVTKEKKPFLAVQFELLGGAIEVMVWPDVLGKTSSLWQESNLLFVVGKVRSRDDRLSISCENTSLYSVNEEGAVEYSNGQMARDVTFFGEGVDRRHGVGDSSISVGGPRTVVVNLMETGETEKDKSVLWRVVRQMLEYPGGDKVNLRILSGGKPSRIEMPIITTRYCIELCKALEELVGEDCVTLEERN
jgi:DNA polymerase-3 subunit alpha